MVAAAAEGVQVACSFDFIFKSINSYLADSSRRPSQSLALMEIQNFRFECSVYVRRCPLLASASQLAGEYTCFSLLAVTDSSER